ncbi:unnamed protein product [Litomosoides sigmodontis]|uniref:Uncharacterized protein n=1 Tax=Litomosoides sigmodontis TaxID=42156 RepID=A0A3P6TK70_LITSI|nr:unnamed protein product [Litomosoides sigmodontis]
MSNKLHGATVLRPSLKKQPSQTQNRLRESSDTRRHVTFVTPQLPLSKCTLSKQQQIPDQDVSKSRKQKSVSDTHRKRIPPVQIVELCAKKNKHNEQIVRLCEAEEALVGSEFVIRRMEKKAKEQEAVATALLKNATSLIEMDVLRSFEKQRVTDLLDSAEQKQMKDTEKLNEELAEFDQRIADIGKALVAVEKCNEMLDMQLTRDEERELSVPEEMMLLSNDINLYLGVLDSLKQFNL